MTEELWKFLFAIYGGGPIMKKVEEGNGEVFKIDYPPSKEQKVMPITTGDFYEK